MFFQNRVDAGQQLAESLRTSGRDWTGWSVVGIARGGVIVGAEIARALSLPLDALVIDDTVLEHGTMVMSGAGTSVWFPNHPTAERPISVIRGTTPELAAEFLGIQDRQRTLNGDHDFVFPRRALICDDGFVTGLTADAAIRVLRGLGTTEIVLAIPVIPPWASEERVGCPIVTWRVTRLHNPTSGIFYFSFSDVPDDEVVTAVQERRETKALS